MTGPRLPTGRLRASEWIFPSMRLPLHAINNMSTTLPPKHAAAKADNLHAPCMQGEIVNKVRKNINTRTPMGLMKRGDIILLHLCAGTGGAGS